MQTPQQSPATISVVISNEYGLHLRPADLFARMAICFVSEITVRHNDRAVNGKSILDLATLAAECGAVLCIEASGPTPTLPWPPWPGLWNQTFRQRFRRRVKLVSSGGPVGGLPAPA